MSVDDAIPFILAAIALAGSVGGWFLRGIHADLRTMSDRFSRYEVAHETRITRVETRVDQLMDDTGRNRRPIVNGTDHGEGQ